MLCHESIGDRAVFAEGASCADFVKPHEPRVTRDVGCDYCRQPASDTTWLLLLHGQAAPDGIILPEMSPDASLSLGRRVVNKWNIWLPENKRSGALRTP